MPMLLVMLIQHIRLNEEFLCLNPVLVFCEKAVHRTLVYNAIAI